MAREPGIWQGFREFERFREELDDLLDRFLRWPAETSGGAPHGPAIESFIEDERVVVRADLPGIDPAKVEVTVRGNLLTIRGSREAVHEEKRRNFIHREVSYGRFERTLTLPAGVASESIAASYRNGILELTIPLPGAVAHRTAAVEGESKGTPRSPARPRVENPSGKS
jgi:HSP20 family protein